MKFFLKISSTYTKLPKLIYFVIKIKKIDFLEIFSIFYRMEKNNR